MNVQSIKDRLKNVARENSRLYQEVLTTYALERTLFRIGVSKYKENFTLKGGIFLYAFYDKEYPRSTTDIDLRADRISGEKKSLLSVFADIFKIEYDDGITFDESTLRAKEITKRDEYKGLNISITALLGNSRLPVSIDIGFGDVIVPAKKEMTFPVLLNMEAPQIYSYSMESTLAEKFEAIVSLGYANSRFKDFYDIYVILQNEQIDLTTLKEAIVQTFHNRSTSFDDIVMFGPSFSQDPERIKRWNSFVKKKRAMVQVSFETVVARIKDFFEPIVAEIELFQALEEGERSAKQKGWLPATEVLKKLMKP